MYNTEHAEINEFMVGVPGKKTQLFFNNEEVIHMNQVESFKVGVDGWILFRDNKGERTVDSGVVTVNP